MKLNITITSLTMILIANSIIGCSNSNNTLQQKDTQENITDSAAYLPTPVGAKIPAYKGYKFVWSDEFNINGRPSSEWSYEHGFERNEELQWYQSDNASVKDGALIIEGRKQQIKNPDYVAGSSSWKTNRQYAEYTSSCLTTSESHSFMYGRFEVRAKIPTASGAWPAIWLLGNKWEWPLNGEIDMMEYYQKDGRPSILANACWGSDTRFKAIWDESVTPFSHFTSKDSDWANKFHIWRMDWDKDFIRLYLDDELLNEVDLSQTNNQGFQDNRENPFNTKVEGFGDYILLNLAMGANGGKIDETKLPMIYMVDYVRVYQKE